MKKNCDYCGKEFHTEYPTKLYCSLKCANQAYWSREEDDYKYSPESAEPIRVFHCKNCGKEVKIFSRLDQRTTYCCGKCAANFARKLAAERQRKRRGNLGVSAGMSLGSLIRREKRNLD